VSELKTLGRYLREVGVPESYYLQVLSMSSSTVQRIPRRQLSDFRGPPASQQWLIERCGDPDEAKERTAKQQIVACQVAEAAKARRAAINKFINQTNPTPGSRVRND
jgi:hypothetical protein